MGVASETLWYIEGHLRGDLMVESIADVIGISRFHATRAFALAYGVSISEYARARRLTLAAQALANGARDILNIALEAGYGSHEAFTRAFKQRYGKAPEQVRAEASLEALNLTEPFPMSNAQETKVALDPPRIEQRDAFLIFGLGLNYGGKNGPSNAAIPSQWERFNQHLGHIEHQVGDAAYGAVTNTDDSGSMLYISGVEVSEFPDKPADFTRVRIPPQTYAVFAHPGHVSQIQAAWQTIWQHGLREANLKAADAPCFERYPKTFNPKTGSGGYELWVPIRS